MSQAASPPDQPIANTSVPISSGPAQVGGDDKQTDDDRIREGSDSTLTSDSRPVLKLRKYGTELAQPTIQRPLIEIDRRLTTGNYSLNSRPDDPNQHIADTDSDISTSSDSEEEQPRVDLAQQNSSPGRRDLGARELNRARVRPWPHSKRKRFLLNNGELKGKGTIANDGRLTVKVSEKANTGYLAKALGSALAGHLHPQGEEAQRHAQKLEEHYASTKDTSKPPRMNIVIMVIGSRGDIQPFLRIGQILQDDYGHRVRFATHPAFRDFIQKDMGLEFFSIGGDPAQLMSFMVNNPGLIPSFETLTSGEVGRRREQMYEMFNGFWRACINTTDDEKDTANINMLDDKFPFVADAIIANPVSFAHYHCAERLGIPVHVIFTMPYTPTQEFPHPMANIKSSNLDRGYTNYMSYPLVDLMVWQGLGDLVNRFRVRTLGLEPVSTLWAPGQQTRMRVPMTYLWSPGLVPKPEDWGPEVTIAGYVFLDLAKSYKPPQDLVNFLKRSDEDKRPIIYIGFGSISGIKDARAFCQLIFDATVKAGVRAVVSRGWGGMGDGMDIPDEVFMIDNVPHDWLFPQLDAVVHHGGAGTTAIGLKLGKPTMIVPFFGDQPFWASMIARAKAGARQVLPLKKLTVEAFVAGIQDCLDPESVGNAQEIARCIEKDGDGAQNAVDAFHRSLALSGKHTMRCGVFEDRVAVWHVKHTHLKLSALAADLLVQNKQLRWNDLVLIQHKKWIDFSGPGEPITGVGGTVVSSFQEAFHGISEIHGDTHADWKRIQRHRSRRKLRAKEPSEQKSRSEKGSDPSSIPVNLIGQAEPIRGSRRPQNQRTDTASTLQEPVPVILAKDVGKGVGHSVKAIVLLPMEVFHSMTLGFRNAPRLYGDRTVRPPPAAVKGLRQGVQVAGKELLYGYYDGAVGIVRLPYLDYRENGMVGLPKGVARGLGGLVLKPIAGTLGLVDYASRGCYASLKRLVRDTERTERWIRQARVAQGLLEYDKLRKQDRAQLTQHQNRSNTRQEDSELRKARSQVQTKWTPENQQQVHEAREREKRPSVLPSRISKGDRTATV